jgi:hypothetical protein
LQFLLSQNKVPILEREQRTAYKNLQIFSSKISFLNLEMPRRINIWKKCQVCSHLLQENNEASSHMPTCIDRDSEARTTTHEQLCNEKVIPPPPP